MTSRDSAPVRLARPPLNCAETSGSADEAILRRLRRISGQLAGIERMVGERRDCAEILIQLAAVQGALRAAGYRVLARHIRMAAAAASAGNISPGAVADEITTLARLLGGPGT